jgi:hypothetical protein
MKKNTEIIEFLINYGEKSQVKVTLIQFLSQKKCFMVHVTLYIENLDQNLELYPDGLEELIRLAWSAYGKQEKIVISSSVKLLSDCFN